MRKPLLATLAAIALFTLALALAHMAVAASDPTPPPSCTIDPDTGQCPPYTTTTPTTTTTPPPPPPTTTTTTTTTTGGDSIPPDYYGGDPADSLESGSSTPSYGQYATLGTCYWATWRDDKGSLFYHREVKMTVDWCGKNWRITKWSFRSVDVSTGLYCQVVYGPVSYRIAGGVGASSVDLFAKAGFQCNLRLVPDPTDYVEVDVRFTWSGGRIDI